MALLYALACAALLLLVFERVAPATAARWGLALERRRSGLATRRLAFGGVSMPYLEGGQGAAILLVHGFGGDKDNFTRVARFLTRSHHVLIPDLPGFGDASRDPQAPYFMADQVEHLRAFLDRLGHQRVHLGGSSMGGFIVAEFAARHPQRVASLWLLDAAGTEAAYQTEIVRHYEASGESPLLLRSVADGAHLMALTMARPAFIPYCVKTALARRGVADFALHTRIMRELKASPLLAAQYQRIDTPALIVWGAEDRILHPDGAAALQALLPHSRVIVMPGIGHLPMVEAPGETARDYLDFLRTLPAGNA